VLVKARTPRTWNWYFYLPATPRGGLSAARFHAIVPLNMVQGTQIRLRRKRILLSLCLVLVGALATLHSAPPATSPLRSATVALDNAPEPATLALIGGALCLVSLRLRRRRK